MVPANPQPARDPQVSEGRSREELLEEVLRLETELQRLGEAAQTKAKRRAGLRRFTAWVGARAFAGSHLYQKSVNVWNAWSTWLRSGATAPWPESPTRDFAAALLARFTRVGVVLLWIAALPLVVALLQLNVLHRQNGLLQLQSELAESARRSGLVFEQSSILDEIDEELDVLHETVPDSVNVRLSPRLAGRIIVFSRSLRPYRYLDDNRLTRAPLSPERGQLLMALMNSQIDLSPFLGQADFSYADLASIRFRPLYDSHKVPDDQHHLLQINLSNANFRSANVAKVTFRYGRLQRSVFENSQIYATVFEDAVLDSANFSNAYILSSRFISTSLEGVGFSGASFLNVVFVEPDFSTVDLKGATFNYGRIEDRRDRAWNADALQLCRARLIRNVRMPTALLKEMQKDEVCARKLVGIQGD